MFLLEALRLLSCQACKLQHYWCVNILTCPFCMSLLWLIIWIYVLWPNYRNLNTKRLGLTRGMFIFLLSFSFYTNIDQDDWIQLGYVSDTSTKRKHLFLIPTSLPIRWQLLFQELTLNIYFQVKFWWFIFAVVTDICWKIFENKG